MSARDSMLDGVEGCQVEIYVLLGAPENHIAANIDALRRNARTQPVELDAPAGDERVASGLFCHAGWQRAVGFGIAHLYAEGIAMWHLRRRIDFLFELTRGDHAAGDLCKLFARRFQQTALLF